MASSTEDRLYFKQRAEQELQRTALATCPEAAQVHARLADYYADLAKGQPPRPARPYGSGAVKVDQ